MSFLDEIRACMPCAPSGEIPWKRVDWLLEGTGWEKLRETWQNPLYHGEGDVYTHTQMVVRELFAQAGFFSLDEQQKTVLFLAALLHDIGKARTTRLENGAWVSPHHASTGSQTVRTFLWQDCGLCGTPEALALRETVCALVRCHMLPVYLMANPEPERIVRKTAAVGELAPGFTWNLLCRLAEADVRGRVADDIDECIMNISLARLQAEEAGCLNGPYAFRNVCARHAWLNGRNLAADQTLFDPSWGEVILLSGLPGTGKDTWMLANVPELPSVSLDRIRLEMGIRPTDEQGAVVQAAQERARGFLRQKQPFVWNATNLTRETRSKLVGLFERYGARVRIVYLETDGETRAFRNMSRPLPVPEGTVARMLEKTVPPMPDEAQSVDWVCV